jgi:hypothetical protein
MATVLVTCGVCYTICMGNQTYQKRQKELARQQKQRDKAARREQRKAEKKKGGPPLEGEDSVAGEIRIGSNDTPESVPLL